ncbi:MAG: hypothetical protein ABI572_06130 [Actinomycetota bacterium]
MPEPTTVWMVHLRRSEDMAEIKGRIDLREDALVFTGAKDEGPVAFPFANVRRAKRLRGSPVLMLEWDHEGDPRRTAFYFSQPPPLEQPEPGRATLPGDPFTTRPLGAFGAIRRSSKRRHQKTNIQYLQSVGISQKDLIRSWVVAIVERRDAL